MGCGVGPVPLALVSLVVEIIEKKCNELKCKEDLHQEPTIQIYMNDLPSNDYKLLFKDLLNLEILKRDEVVPLCLFKAVPGSFYDTLFPLNTLHFVHSSYALHWLSQEPMELYNKQGEAINKGNIYISEKSEENVAKAYLGQFQRDFTQFLKCRTKEVVSKGFMLLTTRGRQSLTNSSTWQPFELNILTNAITCLFHEGLIKEESVDKMNFPVYIASEEEIGSIIKKEGSFEIKYSNTTVNEVGSEIVDKWEKAQFLAKYIGAFSKSLISHHFGQHILHLLHHKLVYHAFQHLLHAFPTQNCAVTFLLQKR
ncbi:caffeine synthase 1-like isoform X1 [Amaranthus tricolor]|uniref:caffeine synthase 1-like isoform X1 n=1 Tax=Amaranthus tricolor TaxID=29722 RepID=UPI00259044B1|nr:caffeine synthase 1-like isoform X1 [Amaranthus tricolor]